MTVGGDVTGGADVTDGDPLTRSVGTGDAELGGAAGALLTCEVPSCELRGCELLSCVLAGEDADPDGAAPVELPWLEQPATVAANTTVRAAITVCDVVRTVYPQPLTRSLNPPPGFTLWLSQPTFIVNRRVRPRES